MHYNELFHWTVIIPLIVASCCCCCCSWSCSCSCRCCCEWELSTLLLWLSIILIVISISIIILVVMLLFVLDVVLIVPCILLFRCRCRCRQIRYDTIWYYLACCGYCTTVRMNRNTAWLGVSVVIFFFLFRGRYPSSSTAGHPSCLHHTVRIYYSNEMRYKHWK